MPHRWDRLVGEMPQDPPTRRGRSARILRWVALASFVPAMSGTLLDGQLLLLFALAALAVGIFSEATGLYGRSMATKRLTEVVALVGFVLAVLYVCKGAAS